MRRPRTIENAHNSSRVLRSAGFQLVSDGSGRTAIQAGRDEIARTMLKRWLRRNPDPRPDHNPRGIDSPLSHCYMNSVLQALMHTPIFLNWIRTHTVTVYCGINCVKCNMKGLAEYYWGPRSATNKVTNTNDHLRRIKRVAWRRSHLEREAHEDANDFLDMFLFDDDHGLAAGDREWKKQFDTIFGVDLVPFDECNECGVERMRRARPGMDLEVPVRPQHPPTALFNSVAEAIRHSFEVETLAQYRCETPTCLALGRTKYKNYQGPPQSRRWVIKTAPRVLKIRLLMFETTLTGGNKMLHTLTIDQNLDLGQYQESNTPLTYRLSTVVSHLGQLNSGHFIGSVRSPGDKRYYNISDSEWIIPIGRTNFTRSPQKNSKTEENEFQVYILTYLMDEPTPPPPQVTNSRMLRELA